VKFKEELLHKGKKEADIIQEENVKHAFSLELSTTA
jgi:hypothetical protein